ncbi:Dynein regulatory complex subunit 6 [Mortierella antarctica]|nr:Dynein regulatory complex subunit 6 [Mortierella antarctica]
MSITPLSLHPPLPGSPSPGPPSPLEIEEVLLEIVLHLDRQSLHSCVSVSKIFYRASIRALWSSVRWKNLASNSNDSFLSQFERYGHYAVELQDNFNANLDMIARVCTNLRELRLTWTLVRDEKLACILRSSPKISRLFLFNCSPLTTLALSHIGNLAGLKRLELKNYNHVDEPSIVALLRSCPMLEHLVLEDVRLNGILLDSLGETPLNIKILALTRSAPSGNLVRNLLRNSRNIKEFSLARNGHSAVSVDELLMIQDSYRHLSNLNLESCKGFDNEALRVLFQTCSSLVRVNVSGTKIEDSSLDALAANCPELKTLNLAWCAHITDGGLLRLLQTCSGLTFLDISTMDKVSAAIFYPGNSWACSRLETLISIGIDMARPRGSIQRNHAMMFNQLSRLETLRDLAIGGTNLVLELEAGLSKLGQLSQLVSFRLSLVQGVLGEDEIRWLIEAWPKLKRVKFEAGSLPSPWLRYFRRRRPHLVFG